MSAAEQPPAEGLPSRRRDRRAAEAAQRGLGDGEARLRGVSSAPRAMGETGPVPVVVPTGPPGAPLAAPTLSRSPASTPAMSVPPLDLIATAGAPSAPRDLTSAVEYPAPPAAAVPAAPALSADAPPLPAPAPPTSAASASPTSGGPTAGARGAGSAAALDPRTRALNLAAATTTAITAPLRRVLAEPPVSFGVDLRETSTTQQVTSPTDAAQASARTGASTTSVDLGSGAVTAATRLTATGSAAQPTGDSQDPGPAPWDSEELTVVGAGAAPQPPQPQGSLIPSHDPLGTGQINPSQANPGADDVRPQKETIPAAASSLGLASGPIAAEPIPAEPIAAELGSPDASLPTTSGPGSTTAPMAATPMAVTSSTSTVPVAKVEPAERDSAPQTRRSRRRDASSPEVAKGSSRAGRALGPAIGVGVLLGAVALGSLLYRKEFFVGLASFAVVISVWELAGALASRRLHVPVVPLGVGALGMLVSAYVAGPEGLVIAFTMTVFGLLLWRIIDGVEGAARDIAAGIFTAAYVPLLAGFSILMLAEPDGAYRVLVFLFTTVCSDIGGYAMGVLFGKHPMAPSLSPKKSWEGFAGSVLACVLAGTLGVSLLLDGPWWAGAVLGASLAIAATFGDLSESLLKRGMGIKDMGNLLPGHGGLMDRMDSLLVAAPIAYLILNALVTT